MMKTPDEIQKYVEQTAAIINLPIDAESIPNVVNNLTQITKMATLVTEFELPEDIEAATIFKP
ncbi:MAG: DUF4089 domain-containing protein [Cyanobacteria bacterium P01_G01_bin.49]